MRVVEFLNEGQGFGFVLSGEDGSQLRGKSGVVRSLLERCAEEGFGFGKLVGGDEDVGEAGVGGGGFGVCCEDAAVGGLGGFGVAGLLSEAGGQECVVRRFGRELEGFQQVVGGFVGSAARSIWARARQARALARGPTSPASRLVARASSGRASSNLFWRARRRPRET